MRTWPDVSTGKRTRPSFWTSIQNAVDEIDERLILIPTGDYFQNQQISRLNVLDRGVVGDGTTDDLSHLQDAYDELGESGGGFLEFPGYREYYLEDGKTTGGLSWMLSLKHSNVHLVGGPGAVLKTNETAGIIHIGQHADDYTAHQLDDLTQHTLATATGGENKVTLATPADAANYSAGDWIIVRTGQCTEDASSLQPDCEIQQVVSADAGTGIIGLRWPLVITYLQEAVDTGGGFTYKSKVGGAGANVPFCVSKIDIIENISVRGLTLVQGQDTSIPIVFGGFAYNVELDHLDIDCYHTMMSAGHIRGMRYTNNQFRHRGNSSAAFIAPSTGCTHWDISDNDATSKTWAYVHMAEGVKNIAVRRNIIANPTQTSGYNHVGVRNRAYGVQILENTFQGDDGPNIYVDGNCPGGGSIGLNRHQKYTASEVAIDISSPNWTVLPSDIASGKVNFWVPGIHTQKRTLSGWVTAASQSIELGWLPATFAVVNVSVRVQQAFNSDGTDLLEVGYSGDDDAYMTALDVSTTGIKSVTLGSKVLWEDDNGRTLIVKYTNGGSEPTEGRALVLVEWSPIQVRPT